jgi:hypothetical protein
MEEKFMMATFLFILAMSFVGLILWGSQEIGSWRRPHEGHARDDVQSSIGSVLNSSETS